MDYRSPDLEATTRSRIESLHTAWQTQQRKGGVEEEGGLGEGMGASPDAGVDRGGWGKEGRKEGERDGRKEGGRKGGKEGRKSWEIRACDDRNKG